MTAAPAARIDELVVANAQIQVALPPALAPGLTPAARLSGSSLYEWLAARLHSFGFEHAQFWSWDPRQQLLTPRGLTAATVAPGEISPRPLALGQGIVGRCAAALRVMVESHVEHGRSIRAYPVVDSHRLYGVLALVPDAVGRFDGGPLDPRMDGVIRTLCEQLHASEHRTVDNLQRSVAAELLNSLSRPDTPKLFWHRLTRILRQLESRGLYASCALYVRRRQRHMQYSCKAASPRAGELRPHGIHADQHPEFRELLALPEGVYVADDQPRRPPLDLLLREPDRSYWVMHDPETFDHDSGPLFFAIATLEPESLHRSTAVSRAAWATLTQLFTGVFAVARAIFAASDNQRLGQERMRIFSAATHDMRAPVASLRHFAEALTGLEGDNAVRQQHILRLADEAILRIENVLYEWWSTDQKTPAFSLLDPEDFVAELVEQVRAHRPEPIVLQSGDGALAGHVLRAHALSLNLALKNVLDNAIKFGNGAPVHVKLRAVDGDAGRDGPAIRKLVIEIRDHGIGIPVESRRAVFDYGYRTEHSRKYVVRGAGVGLSITRSIIESHGGNIWVDASIPPTAGTSMVIALPLHRRS